jgi:hypothetical protein
MIVSLAVVCASGWGTATLGGAQQGGIGDRLAGYESRQADPAAMAGTRILVAGDVGDCIRACENDSDRAACIRDCAQ